MMPAAGSAPNRALIPPGMKPAPPAVKLPVCQWVSSTMMASTGTATFHQVMTLLTRAKMRMARKLTATKIAIRMIVRMKPTPVTFFVSES